MYNTYYKNQNNLINSLKYIIDNYWNKSISESDMIDRINLIVCNNIEMVFSGGDFSPTVKQRCGRKNGFD